MGEVEKLLELAERVEKATGPERTLDAEIWCALNGAKFKNWYDVYGNNSDGLTQVEYTLPPKRTPYVTNGRQVPHALPYTASLDAAMTLVPEGLSVTLYIHPDDAHADIFRLHPSKGMVSEAEQAHTPALALTAAALRARARMSDGGEG